MSSLEPFSGFGLGLRKPHYQEFLQRRVPVDFVEVISENFMIDGGRPLQILDAVRERHPVALHGVSMSVGSADGLRPDYLERLKVLADRIDPLWVSDHLCWTGVHGFNSHDLLPLPYTEEALATVCDNIKRAQEVLERPILLENPSSYLAFSDDMMTEWEFIAQTCRLTGCFLLLDVNNVYVSGANHGFDPYEYIAHIPAERVVQMHLAGHSRGRELLIDTHDEPVSEGVWALYEFALRRFGHVATMIERDDNIPPLSELITELDSARTRARAASPARQGAS